MCLGGLKNTRAPDIASSIPEQAWSAQPRASFDFPGEKIAKSNGSEEKTQTAVPAGRGARGRAAQGVVLRIPRFHAKTVHIRANDSQKVEKGVGSLIFNGKPLECKFIPVDKLRDGVNEVEGLMG